MGVKCLIYKEKEETEFLFSLIFSDKIKKITLDFCQDV